MATAHQSWLHFFLFPFFVFDIYLSGFAKRYLQDFLATVSFQACSALDLFLFVCYDVFSTKKKFLTSRSSQTNVLKTAAYIFPHNSPPPLPHPYPLPIISHNSLSVIMSVRGRSCFPWSFNFLDFLLAACSKVFWKASFKPYEWTSLTTSSLPSSNKLPYFVSFWRKGWNTDLGLEMEGHHIANFDVGGDESLASKSSL